MRDYMNYQASCPPGPLLNIKTNGPPKGPHVGDIMERRNFDEIPDGIPDGFDHSNFDDEGPKSSIRKKMDRLKEQWTDAGTVRTTDGVDRLNRSM